jgi:glycosyltransferase involved in cell wall biosynthesis
MGVRIDGSGAWVRPTRFAVRGEAELSVVVPLRDEEENLEPLYEQLCKALDGRLSWELLLIDDGSRDRSWELIERLCTADGRVRGASLASPHGQSSAIFLGADLARGRLIATLDGDLQNDPADLPRLLEALREQAAVVGYRQQRRDNLLRRLSSRIANAVRDVISGDHVRDTGCGMKLFRTEALRALPRFEGMHRFLPTLLRYQGLQVSELPVAHRARVAGRSKYGVRNRMFRAFFDLLAVRWMRSRMIRTEASKRFERCSESEV